MGVLNMIIHFKFLFRRSSIIQVLYLVLFCFACSTKNEETNQKDVKQKQLFSLLDPHETGVNFNNKILQTDEEYIITFNYIFNGAGVAIADFDQDGLQDLYFTGNQVSDRLYHNKGDMKFEDLSVSSGIAKYAGWKNGVSIVDINADGYPDIYICRGGFKDDPEKNKNLLFINQKNLKFTEEAEKYGIADVGFSITANFFDMDNDHDLDLYVSNRPERWEIGITDIVRFKSRPYTEEMAKVTHQLYRNEGNGQFTNITKDCGIQPTYSYGLSVTAGDINNDGFQDIYVANDFIENDYLFVNNGKGGFKEEIRDHFPHVSFYSMGADFGDLNNDGFEELYTVEMRPEDYKRSKTSIPLMNVSFFDSMYAQNFHRQYMHNMLHYNYGNGKFGDISQITGMDKTDWSWAALMNDLDNDGYKDVFVSNGFRMDVYDRDGNERLKQRAEKNADKGLRQEGPQSLFEFLPAVKLADYVYQNQGGLKFVNKMKDWGLREPNYSNGAAMGDLDNDGDLDLVISNIDEEAFIYRSNEDGDHPYLRIQCEGPGQNKTGIGARISIWTSHGMQFSQMRTSKGYLSSCEPFLHFGLGNANRVDRIKVVWPDGKVSEYKDVKPNQIFKVKYSDALNDNSEKIHSTFLFSNLTKDLLDQPFVHRENYFNDYRSQILLPHRLSRQGPFLAVKDVNADGLEDFYVGGGKGQPGVLYLQTLDGKFIAGKVKDFENDKNYEDVGGDFFDADGDGDFDLYVISGDTESKEGPTYQDRLYLNDGKANFHKSKNLLPEITSSGSCIAVSDVDGDGDLDIFRGSRAIPDKYPFPPKSYFLENSGKGQFKDVTSEKAKARLKLGMVTSAVWVDLNKDKIFELIVVGEWMPVSVFEWKDKNLIPTDPQKYGFSNTEGWWNKILAEDLNGDGELDLIGGNLGENYKFHASIEKPFQVYCDDYDQNGSYDVFLAKFQDKLIVPVRGKQCASEQLPSISKKFPTFRSFADAGIKDLLPKVSDNGILLETKFFSSAFFIKKQNDFELMKLPIEAQFAPVQSILVDDLNGDGIKDILLAGNQLQSEIETTRADAGIGCLLMQDKNKKWEIVPAHKSGISIPYDVKDMKILNVKGKKHLIVASNADSLRIFDLSTH